MYTKELPFKLSVYKAGDNYHVNVVNAWMEKNVVMVKVDCQTHSIQDWRDKGRGLIATKEVENDTDGVSDALYNLLLAPVAPTTDTLTKVVSSFKERHTKLVAKVEERYWLLCQFLDLIETVFARQVEEQTKKAEKRKEKTKAATKTKTTTKKVAKAA